MKLYIAAPWVDRAALPEFARRAESDGHEITERWWEHRDVPNYPNATTHDEDEELRAQAVADWRGVRECDVFILVNSGKSEGKAVETGIALVLHKPIILVGFRSNLFHWLVKPQHIVATFNDALVLLQSSARLPALNMT